MINSDKIFPQNIGDAHLLTNRAKVLKIESGNSILVEILPNIIKGELYGEAERKNEYMLIVGDTIMVTFSKTNNRANDFIKKLEVGSIINISRYNNTKVNLKQTPPVLECIGIDIYDADGNTIIEYY